MLKCGLAGGSTSRGSDFESLNPQATSNLCSLFSVVAQDVNAQHPVPAATPAACATLPTVTDSHPSGTVSQRKPSLSRLPWCCITTER